MRLLVLTGVAVVVTVAAVQPPSSDPTPQGVELFEPGIISTDGGEAFPSFNPNGAVLYFATHDPNWSAHTLMVSVREPEGWSRPRRLPFSGTHNDRAPRLSPDGSRLFFSSDRPLRHTQGAKRDFNIWMTTPPRVPGGEWSEPIPLPEAINTVRDEYHTSVTSNGTLFFAGREWEGGYGRSDLYQAAYNGGMYGPPTNLGPPVNDELSQPDCYVSPDGRFMILAITDHPEGRGGDDLYVSYRREGGWSRPVNLGEPVNSPEYEYGPTISGRYLYFTSHRRGNGDIYRIPVAELPVELGAR